MTTFMRQLRSLAQKRSLTVMVLRFQPPLTKYALFTFVPGFERNKCCSATKTPVGLLDHGQEASTGSYFCVHDRHDVVVSKAQA